MTNREIAETLFNIAAILEPMEGNVYRVRAYRRAAMVLLRLPKPLAPIVRQGHFPKLPHIGVRLTRKISELILSGKMAFYEELWSVLPPGQRQLMIVPGVGPRIAERLNRELQVSTPEELLVAAQAGRIRRLYRFGVKSEQNLAEAAAQVVRQHAVAADQPLPAPLPGRKLPILLSTDSPTIRS